MIGILFLFLMAISLSLPGIITGELEQCLYNSHISHNLAEDDEGVIMAHTHPNIFSRFQVVCDINLVACVDCVVEIQFVDFNYPKCLATGEKPTTRSMNCDHLSCQYFLIKDGSSPPLIYGGNRTGSTYRSASNFLQLRYCFSLENDPNAPRKWMIRYKTVPKVPIYTSPNVSAVISLQSEGYPMRYGAVKKRYLIQSPDPSGRVVLLFDDLVLAHNSVLKIYDGPTTNALFSLRRSFQRSMFTSSGREVLLVFDPGPTSGDWVYQPGFKLTAEFNETTTSIVDSLNQGYIWFQTKYADDYAAFYDYVWYVRAPEGLRTFIKLAEFKWWGNLKLEIRNGNNSQGRLAQTLTTQHNGWVDRMGGYDSYTGFYLRLTGKSASLDSFLLAVTAFSAHAAPSNDFCELKYGTIAHRGFYCVSDSRCIPASRKCDGLAHCTSNIDEDRVHCPNPVTVVHTMAPPVITTLAPCFMKAPFMYRCDEDRNVCVFATSKCDGKPDCPQASDEKYCHPSRTVPGPDASPAVKLGTRNNKHSEETAPSDEGRDDAWLFGFFGSLLIVVLVGAVCYRKCKREWNDTNVEAQTSDSRLHTARLRLSSYLHNNSTHRSRNGTPSHRPSRPVPQLPHQNGRLSREPDPSHTSNRHRQQQQQQQQPQTRFNFEDSVIATIVSRREAVRFHRGGGSPVSPRSDYLSDPASPRSLEENPYEQIGPRSPDSYRDFLDDNGSYRLYGTRDERPPSYDEVLGGVYGAGAGAPAALDDSYMTQESLPSYDEVRELIPQPRPSRSRLGSTRSHGEDNPASQDKLRV